MQPGRCQRCGAAASGGVCVPPCGLCSITATPKQGFGGTGTTKIHQQWARAVGVGWMNRIRDFKAFLLLEEFGLHGLGNTGYSCQEITHYG